MQILIFSLIIIAFIVFIIYKIKKTFSKKEIYSFFTVITILIIGMIYYNDIEDKKLPSSFKEHYFNEKNIEIIKMSYTQTNMEILSNSKEIYDFVYIVEKENKQYICEAKNVEAQKIEDEYVFKKYKEDCRLK